MGDYHVRFCERLGVKLPLATRHPLCALNVVNPLNLPIARGGGEITHRLYDRWRRDPPKASLQEKPSNYSKVLNAVRVWY